MNTENLEIKNIIALFHSEEPVSHSLEEIRLQENDSRYVLYVNYPEGKFVIKIAANDFTTVERVNGWVDLIAEYREMGYYSPSIKKSINNNYAERFVFKEKSVVVWEEEYAKYHFPNDIKNKAMNANSGRYTYKDEVIEFFGKVGQKHLKGFFGKSGWVRLEPFETETDEVTDCVQTFNTLVKNDAPHFMERWQKILGLFEQNREELGQVYHKLPTSVFQADWGESNLLLDDKGHFKGVIDYNLAGEDTVLNIFMSLSLFGFGCPKKVENNPEMLPELNEETQNSVIEIMLDAFRGFKKHYQFSEIEVEAALLLYKYIIAIEYTEIRAFKENMSDDSKLKLLFDFMEQELLRDDIDFRSAMLN